MPSRVSRRDDQRATFLNTRIMAGLFCGVAELYPCNRPGRVAAVQQQDRRRMLQAEPAERRLIRVLCNPSRYRQTIEPGELGLNERRRSGIGVMHEPAGGVHMLADVLEPQAIDVALEPVERPPAHNF